MIDGVFPIELNGVKYRLAEDAEGEHYDRQFTPLRTQTGQIVQGESGKFQLRPDLIEWSLTDWSGGEGELVFDQERANRYWVSHNVDGISQPGKLILAPGYQETLDNAGATFAQSLALVKARNELYGVPLDETGVYVWNAGTGRWNAKTANGSQVNSGAPSVAGDSNYLFYKEDGADDIWRYDGTTFVILNTDTTVTGEEGMAALSTRIYLVRTGTSAGVYEIAKTGTTPVASTKILDLVASGAQAAATNGLLAAGDNQLWFLQVQADVTVLWKIVPTTAAGAGAGIEELRIPGFRGEQVWTHFGVVFIAGRIGTSGNARDTAILYLRGGEMGVIANLRDGTSTDGQVVSTGGHTFERTYFLAKYGPGDFTHEWTLFALDLISGNVSGLTVFNVGESTQPETLVEHNGELFFGKNQAASTKRTYRTLSTAYVNTNTVSARLDTSINDFGISANKVLLQVELSTDPLPSGSSVEVQYQKDQSGAWVSAGIYSTASGTGTTFNIAGSVTFRNLQLRIILKNGGTTVNTPTLRGVTARATVIKGVRTWGLLLDCTDEDAQLQDRSWSGKRLIDNIRTAYTLGTFVTLKDGYGSELTNDFTTHDVVIDSAREILSQPGEGIIQVQLREVSVV